MCHVYPFMNEGDGTQYFDQFRNNIGFFANIFRGFEYFPISKAFYHWTSDDLMAE